MDFGRSPHTALDLYLVDNAINRWSIGDRTPDFTLMTMVDSRLSLSAKEPADPSNWLPVPDGPFMLGMRVYEGAESVLTCEWFPPPLIPID